jgi:hypothetical protein
MAVVENLGLLLGSAVPSFMDTLKFIRQSQENAEQLRIQRARLAADQRVAELRQRIEDLQAVDDVRQAVFTEGDTRWNTAYVDAITNVGKEQADALFFRGEDPVVMTESDLDSVMDLTKRVTATGGAGGAGLIPEQKNKIDYYKGIVDFQEQGVNNLRTERSNLVAQRDQFNTGATQYGRMQQQIDNLDSEIQRREQGLSVARRDLQNAIENPDLSFGGIEDRTKEQIELLQRSTTPTQIQGGSSFGPPSVFGFPQPPTYPAGSPLNSATINPRIEVNQGVTPTAQDTTGARQMLEQLREQDQEALRILGDTSRRTY